MKHLSGLILSLQQTSTFMLLNNRNPKHGLNEQPRKGLTLLACLRNMLKDITHTSESTKSKFLEQSFQGNFFTDMLAKRDTPIIRGAFKSVGKNQRWSTAVFSIVFENNTSLMDYFLPTIFFP